MRIVFFNLRLLKLFGIFENNVLTQVIMNHQEEAEEEEGEPYFSPATTTNLTCLVGGLARLSCSVQNLGNKTVSGGLENY